MFSAIDIKNLANSDLMQIRTELCEIMAQEGSDKCSDWHNYTPIYHEIFSSQKDQNIKFFELGIFHGSSVRGWRKYFKHAKIVAADVNQEYLINDEGITSYVCDQDSVSSIEGFCKNFESSEYFDIMIEDGKHEFSSNLNFLLNSYQILKKGGIYVIEDLTISTWNQFQSCSKELIERLNPESFCFLDIPNHHNTIDNRLLIIVK